MQHHFFTNALVVSVMIIAFNPVVGCNFAADEGEQGVSNSPTGNPRTDRAYQIRNGSNSDFPHSHARRKAHGWEGSPSNSRSGGGGICFSADMTVGDGTRMDELKVGDAVVAADVQPNIGEMEGRDATVLTFIHANRVDQVEFILLATESGRILELSETHVLFGSPSLDGPVLDVVAGTLLELDDDADFYLVRQDDSGPDSFVLDRVVGVEQITKQGFFAPLTDNGVVVVNDFVVSAYSTPPVMLFPDFPQACERHDVLHHFFMGAYDTADDPSAMVQQGNGEINQVALDLMKDLVGVAAPELEGLCSAW